jgi:predicted O-methyltransferase YrrM
VSGYLFTSDWFSQHIPTWEKYVKPRFTSGDEQRRFLEVGSYEGRSTVWILENLLTRWNDKMVCVDHFDASYKETFFRNVARFIIFGTVRTEERESFEALCALNQENSRFDGIYIDAGHMAKETLSDLVLSWPLLKRGGILIIDDYEYHADKWPRTPTLQTPKPAIDVFLRMYKKDLVMVHKGYQVMVEKL